MTPQPTFRIRSEADILALVPYTLGFLPEDSLVLITLSSESHPFLARIDLPDDADHLESAARQLAQAAVRNDASRAMIVAYTEDECLAEIAAARLQRVLGEAGVETLVALRADGSHWFRALADDDDPRRWVGVPYDVRTHRLTSQAVLEGRVTFASRDELADTLSIVDPDEVETIALAHEDLTALDVSDHNVMLSEGQWLVQWLRSLTRGPAAWMPHELARGLRALQEADLRDLALVDITRESSGKQVQLWREIVRRSPEELVGPAAGLLAFASWQAGDGALAWCAIERCLAADPDNSLARLVGRTLETAMPPSEYRHPDPTSLRLFAG